MIFEEDDFYRYCPKEMSDEIVRFRNRRKCFLIKYFCDSNIRNDDRTKSEFSSYFIMTVLFISQIFIILFLI